MTKRSEFKEVLPYLIAVLALGLIAYWFFFDSGKVKRKNAVLLTKEVKTMAMLSENETLKMTLLFETQPLGNDIGLGFFKPNIYNRNVLYFYGNLNMEKSVREHNPIDSITFKRNENNQIEITYAPAWFVRDQMQLDYDHLYFPLKSVSNTFLEIIKNTEKNKKGYVDRTAGEIVYWQDFLLNMHSVEFPSGTKQKVYQKPSETSEVIKLQNTLMKPVVIRNQWMWVALQDEGSNMITMGWIQWRNEKKLLILYNPMS